MAEKEELHSQQIQRLDTANQYVVRDIEEARKSIIKMDDKINDLIRKNQFLEGRFEGMKEERAKWYWIIPIITSVLSIVLSKLIDAIINKG